MAMKPEGLVARLVFFGGVASVVFMLIGLMAVEIHALVLRQPIEAPRIVENRDAGRSVDVFVSMAQLGHALRRWPPDPVAVMTLGIVMLLITPALGVTAALIGFIRERDRVYSVISTLLLVALVFGLMLRLGG
jgi:uncharacterized membrane protein